MSETNIFGGGFLRESLNAQWNLAINQAAGVNSFAYPGTHEIQLAGRDAQCLSSEPERWEFRRDDQH